MMKVAQLLTPSRSVKRTVTESLEITIPGEVSHETIVYEVEFCDETYRWKCPSDFTFPEHYYWTIYEEDRTVIRISNHDCPKEMWIFDAVKI